MPEVTYLDRPDLAPRTGQGYSDAIAQLRAHPRLLALGFLASLAVVLLSVVPPARAQDTPGPDLSAIQQYVEELPTGGGVAVPGVTEDTRSPLPSAAEEALRYAPPETAALLRTIATSATYGAPPPARAGRSPSEPTQSSPGDAVWRSVDAAGSASDGRLLALVLLVIALTAGAGALAARRTIP